MRGKSGAAEEAVATEAAAAAEEWGHAAAWARPAFPNELSGFWRDLPDAESHGVAAAAVEAEPLDPNAAPPVFAFPDDLYSWRDMPGALQQTEQEGVGVAGVGVAGVTSDSDAMLRREPARCPMFLEPNHYWSDADLATIQTHIVACCLLLHADFVYHDDQFSYRCSAYHRQAEVHFWINIFQEDGRHLIELQKLSGDGFGFIDVVRTARDYLYTTLVQPPAGYVRAELRPVLDAPIASVHEAEYEAAALRNILAMAHAPYCDVQSEALIALADLSARASIQASLAADPSAVAQLVPLLRSGHVTIHRCAATTLANLLEGASAAKVVALVVRVGGVRDLAALVCASPPMLSTSPHVLRQCLRALLAIATVAAHQDAALLALLASLALPWASLKRHACPRIAEYALQLHAMV